MVRLFAAARRLADGGRFVAGRFLAPVLCLATVRLFCTDRRFGAVRRFEAVRFFRVDRALAACRLRFAMYCLL